ncbi:oligosaccharide flippase family protein [Actinomyces sp.]|uniref:lipopolysaccharide biosynthesis protein n=1 Tax=Actinomyces sp. TaxID=29317 RepID=UPI00289A44AB|nr:oligosaccharide flippase family protein [Actinomyces sp.]
MDLGRRMRSVIARSPVVLDAGTLLSGTVIAQVVVLVTTPLVSRLYTPDEKGLFVAFMAIPQTVAVVAGLRYDMAVVLPERDADARRLVRAVIALAAVVSALTSAVTWAAAPTIARWMGHPELEGWLVWSGAVVMATVLVNVMGYWFTRTRSYRVISFNRVQQSASVEGVKVLSGWAGYAGVGGQMLGQVLGQVAAAVTLLIRGRDSWAGPTEGAASTREILRRYRRMPLLNAPNALVDAFRTNGIVLLIGYFYSSGLLGQFSQAWLLMQAPVALVNGALSQVFFQKFATVPRGGMRDLVDRSVRASLLAGVVPFALLAVLAPFVFPWFLGPNWSETGLIGQALVPWLYLNVATSPISTVFVVAERQGLMLLFAVVYAATPLGLIAWLGGAGVGIVGTMWAVSGAMALLLAGLVLLTRAVSSAWDGGAGGTAGVPVVEGAGE